LASAVDPDTGVDFANQPGTLRDRAALSAWGGSEGRSWFYDQSAGPDYVNYNFDVDDADLDGDGVDDYRIPPAWEYAADDYRSRAELPADLAGQLRPHPLRAVRRGHRAARAPYPPPATRSRAGAPRWAAGLSDQPWAPCERQ
jgi:hypothetical protein